MAAPELISFVNTTLRPPKRYQLSLYKDPPEAITYYYSTPWKWIVIELRTLRKQLNRNYPPLMT